MDRFPRVRIAPSFLLVLAISILTLPFPWVVSVIIASIIHEIGHVFALRFLDVKIFEINIDSLGAKLVTDHMNAFQEILSALAGPLFGIGMLFFSGLFPRIAFCGCIQGLLNLIPLYSSDGGRVLSVLLNWLFSPNIVRKIVFVVKWMILIALGSISAWFYFALKLGIISFVPCVLIMVKYMMSNNGSIKYCLQTREKKDRIQ